jgi:2,3-bisphosphoglycerate-independent phosphoglycerate mutase
VFEPFARPCGYLNLHYVCFTQYDITINAPVAYPPQDLANTLGEVVSKAGLQQLRIAETEKYAHVTFFFNGGIEEAYPGEERILIPSPKVATYNLKPEMSACEISEKVLERIHEKEYDLIVLNYANPDMVGHTGQLEAGIKAIETVDYCLDMIIGPIVDKGGAILITADHGNAEQMEDKLTNQPLTSHTSNMVPVILVGKGTENLKLRHGALKDVAPTILDLMGLPKPPEMTGESLIVR